MYDDVKNYMHIHACVDLSTLICTYVHTFVQICVHELHAFLHACVATVYGYLPWYLQIYFESHNLFMLHL